MLNFLLVDCGGFIGSALRYLVGMGAQYIAPSIGFPYGTLTVNVLGCLLIGFLGGVTQHRDAFTPEIRLFIFTGMLGGFTTFSAFGYDTFNLARNVDLPNALFNILLHIVLGIGGVCLGYWASRWC